MKLGKTSGFAEFVKNWWWKILLILAIVAALGTAGYFGYNYLTANKQAVNGAQADGPGQPIANVEALIAEIKTHIMLPNEAPEVATISDVTVLKGQDFYKNAKNGDAVLIFKKAGRGLIYRPSTKMIIEYTKVEYRGDIGQ